MKKLLAIALCLIALLGSSAFGQAFNLSNYATKIVIPNNYSTVCEPAVGFPTSPSSSYYLCTAVQGLGFGIATTTRTYTNFSVHLSSPVPNTQKWVEFAWFDKTTSNVGGDCLISAGSDSCVGNVNGGTVNSGDEVAVTFQTQRTDNSTTGSIAFEKGEWSFQ